MTTVTSTKYFRGHASFDNCFLLIIYMTKLLDSDWLRKECKMCNTSAKSVIQCKLHTEILDYDWLINNRV